MFLLLFMTLEYPFVLEIYLWLLQKRYNSLLIYKKSKTFKGESRGCRVHLATLSPHDHAQKSKISKLATIQHTGYTGVFRIMSNIEDGALYVNCEQLKDYFAKKSMFFFSIFFSQTLVIHGTAGKGMTIFILLYYSYPLMNLQIFKCNFASKMTPRVLNCSSACNCQTVADC